MKTVIGILAIVMTVALTAKAETALSGTDQNGQACQLALVDGLHTSKPTKHDACFFDSDGEGPWCNGQPPVYSVKVSGQGEFQTAAGSQNVTLDDKYAILDNQGKLTGFTGTAEAGGTLDVKVNGNTITASLAFQTAYAKTLTADQINNALLHRDPNVSYESVYNQYYTDVTCTIQH